MQNILIISSCTKKKALPNTNSLFWEDLSTPQKRKTWIKSDIQKLPANQLYTGHQMKLINEGIKALRVNSQVEHWIISAGFGLVPENTKLPSYDSSFSTLTKPEIIKRSNNLQIKKKLEELNSNYDMIYLALGKEYLTSILPLDETFNATEIVHFNRKPLNLQNEVQVFETPFLGKKDGVLLPYGIGGSINAKGGLLYNFAHFVNKKSKHNISFSNFLEKLHRKYGTR